jgi:uncharacterized membrane protein YfcA
MTWPTTLAGFCVGMMVGLTGVGGGALMTPILVLAFGVAPVTAVGTDLWFAAVTKMVGGAIHHSLGGVDWQVLRRLWLGSLPLSLATLLWMHYSGIAQAKPRVILVALGGVLLLTAVAMLCMRRTLILARSLHTHAPDRFRRAQPALTVLAGAILGVLVTLTSVSAGALGIAMLLYLHPYRLTPARLVGTDIIHAIPLTIVAGTGHLLMNNVRAGLLCNLLLGSIPGIALASVLGPRLPQNALRGAIAILLAAVGLKLVTS